MQIGSNSGRSGRYKRPCSGGRAAGNGSSASVCAVLLLTVSECAEPGVRVVKAQEAAGLQQLATAAATGLGDVLGPQPCNQPEVEADRLGVP